MSTQLPPCPVPTFQEACQTLCQTDTQQARTLLYLRLLYSPACSDFVQGLMASHARELPDETLAFLKTVDFSLLALEQEARAKNLYRYFARALPELPHALPADLLETWTRAFMETVAFWEARGRSLLENMALTVYDQHATAFPLACDILKLFAILSGLAAHPEKPSPWGNDRDPAWGALLPGAVVTETFLSDWRLLDARGQLPTRENEDEISAAQLHRVVIAVLPDQIIFPFSLKF